MKKGGIAIIGSLIGGVVGVATMGKFSQGVIKDKDKRTSKFKSYYNMLNQWLCIKQEGKNLEEYFKLKNYKRIAVYGLGEMGNRLIDELNNTEIEIVYGIDKNVDDTFCNIKAYSIDEIGEIAESVDAVVVTAVFAYDEIKEQLKLQFDSDIVSLEDAVFEI